MNLSVKAIAKGNVSSFPTRGSHYQFPPSHASLMDLGSVSMVSIQRLWPAGSQFTGAETMAKQSSGHFKIRYCSLEPKQIASCGQIIQKPYRLGVSVLSLNDCEGNWGSVGDPWAWIEMWKPGLWFCWVGGHLVIQPRPVKTFHSGQINITPEQDQCNVHGVAGS